MALDGCRQMKNHTTTNQKHAGAMKEVKEGSCDWQGERGGSANQLMGAIKLGSTSN
jgi:hypothetical protein